MIIPTWVASALARAKGEDAAQSKIKIKDKDQRERNEIGFLNRWTGRRITAMEIPR